MFQKLINERSCHTHFNQWGDSFDGIGIVGQHGLYNIKIKNFGGIL